MRVREAREQDAAAMARVLIESTRSAFGAFIPRERLLAFTPEESARNWARTLRGLREAPHSEECLLVAETAAGEVVGVAMGGPERAGHPRYVGEVKVLVVLPAYQRQGVGRRLVRAVVGHLVQRGAPSFLIRVVEPNAAARRFYEALGGRIVPDVRERLEEDGVVLEQIAYGWADAAGFLAGAAGDGTPLAPA
jgi:ribosomal protein S18 acetylase RimI-like enzyme